MTAIILALPLIRGRASGTPAWNLIVFGLLAAIPASDLAIALINRVVTDLLGPRTLPRLELRDGVPESLRTIIVMPILLTSVEEIKEQVERLEVHYLANPDGDLRFALLSDWTDAPQETMPTDGKLLSAATDGIANLNRLHGSMPAGGDRFFLFHRKRVRNECQKGWMGWERKRGKLHELNLLLRGSANTTFIPVGGRVPGTIPGIRYVITLDSDTRLPRGAAARLVGTMAHPMNLPKFSPRAGRVVEGYSLVQPRITPALPTDREGSIFQKIFSGPSGMDPYASAVSDVYQDLFREGSYTGKGIYDIDAFEESLAGKVPENSLLSHDLFEGLFARAALATDIEFFEEFPSHYGVATSRQHRWARGDWQLLPWIFGNGGKSSDGHHPYTLPAISRWKMLDNLRRTLSAPTMFLSLVVGWLMAPPSPWTWTGFILLMISVPALLPFFLGLRPRQGGISRRSHLRAVLSDFTLAISQIALTITFLAYQAWLMSDAIVRTLVRLWITRKNLLEWVTAAQAKNAVALNVLGIFRRMSGGVILALCAFVAVSLGQHRALPIAMPFILLWIASPAVASWISASPKLKETEPLSAANTETLRLISRQTWRFFEEFVTAEDNFLPPDNLQVDPAPVVAHRTSPTNIGLYMLSTIAAHDLGWIGTLEAVERIEATMATVGKLESFRGHLLNWYDTRDLSPLNPKYVSSVDSGNLAGHLLVLGNSCRTFIQNSTIDARVLAGMKDSILLLQQGMAGGPVSPRTQTVTQKQLSNAMEALAESLEPLPSSVLEWTARVVELRERARTLDDIAQTLRLGDGTAQVTGLHTWAAAAKA
ncbi:MAG: glycosyl transferase, partial [Bryobacteraceae bacterium]